MAALQADDNSYYSVSAPSFGNATDYYATVPGLPSSPASLTAVWTAKTSVSCTAATSVWNWGSSTWTSLDTRSLGTVEATVSTAVPAPLSNYLSGGTMRVRLRCSRSTTGQFTLSTDVLRVDF